jgi:uncharacterized membrane protein
MCSVPPKRRRSEVVAAKPQQWVGVSMSLYGLVAAAAGVANGTHQVAASLNLGLPGITSVSPIATVGERPVGSGWLTVGSEGASVHTAQTRVLLSVQLGGGASPVVNLPLYVEVASGTATLNSVNCGHPNVSTSTATLGVTPGIVDAWIGNVSVADLTTSPPSLIRLQRRWSISAPSRSRALRMPAWATPLRSQ